VTPLPANVDRAALADDRWQDLDNLKRLVSAGESYDAAERKLGAFFNDIGFDAKYDSIRAAVVTKGKSIFRFLNSDYRNQIALLRSYLKIPLPKSQEERLELIDQMIGAQKVKAVFEASEPAGPAFGSLWKGARSEWGALGAILNWRINHMELPASLWQMLSRIEDVVAVEAARGELEKLLPDMEAVLEELVRKLSLDLRRAFSVSETSAVPLASLSDRLEAWSKDMEGLSQFILFASRTHVLAELGGASLAEAIHDGLLSEKTLSDAFEHAYAEVLRGALFSAWPELRAFDGEEHNNLVAQFRGLDKLRIELAQEQIVLAHAADRPGGAGGIGPLGVLNAEIAKKRGHLPIRTLLDRAGPAIQQLKPVFMMSPLSVAQFLRPGGLHFDLLVMDEASQIEPVDSLGAIARADQVVVVGDERQLPPTAFFKKLTGEEDPEEADDSITLQAKDAESVLDLCLAKGLPHRMLNWHYRSKHQSLIAVSNREFYENKLFIVPSPYDAASAMGLKFNHLKDTAYDRGETRTNPKEAKAVAEAVIRHARANPAQTLGVATFSVAQRQAILKELELMRRTSPELEEFFSGARHEPFFVKNLENIQGDERDVIFISVGYGKTREGYLAHAFGPLSGEGGERRLNVLISRAKIRCEVFCNFTGADLDLERTRSRGVAALKLFLTFAETGNFGLGEVTRDDFDSEFELQVYERLRSLGYDVKRQIGASGFRVDLAISDDEAPGRFVIGIECDGAQYHSSRSARDRDRLRQQVLEAHGWIIHRIWSADWYLRPQAELKKIEAAVVAAKAEWAARDEGRVLSGSLRMSFQGETRDDEEIVTATVEAPSPVTATGVVYSEAAFPVNRRVEPHEAPLADMAAYVVKIVELEGPIHFDEIIARVRGLWGLARAGSRIRAAVERAVRVATDRGLIEGGPFYQLPNQKVIARDRSAVTSATLRKPEMLPPAEIDAAIIQIVGDNFGARREEIVMAVSRLLGYAATSAQLRFVLIAGVERLIEARVLVAKNDLLVPTKGSAA
jgi:very-short-patch-repair endonuclease